MPNCASARASREARDRRDVLRELVADDLDRDALAEDGARGVDRAHPALADLAVDLVLTDERAAVEDERSLLAFAQCSVCADLVTGRYRYGTQVLRELPLRLLSIGERSLI